MGRWACGATVWVAIWTAGAAGRVVSFEDVNLPSEGYWNGSDGSGGFTSGGVFFNNAYTELPTGTCYWEGFACSNRTDASTSGSAGQYNAISGSGQGGSGAYAIGFVGWSLQPKVELDRPGEVRGLYVTNVNYTYYSMLRGDAFSKRFGGNTGHDPDWLLLTITGRDSVGAETDRVKVYLADLRFDDDRRDTILKGWAWVDLRALGRVKTLEFVLSSSDVGAFGMNTPAYFAMDTIVLEGLVESDAGIHGFIDPNTHGPAGPRDPNAIVHPAFRGWATAWSEYRPGPHVDTGWDEPNKALDVVTGDNSDIVSLGELWQEDLASGKVPGSITLVFGDPCNPNDPRHIRDGAGFDIAVFENAFASQVNTLAGSVSGQMLAELAFVEVSTNGRDFARFPSLSLTDRRVGAYGTIDVRQVQGLAGRHPNGYSQCMGTAFDLQVLAGDPLVTSGLVDLTDIRYVRIVDIPGSGDFLDQAIEFIDPCSGPDWTCYARNRPIYDQWPTWGSGGFDLEAVGVLHPQQHKADIDLSGQVDSSDRDLLMSAWGAHPGEPGWIGRADLNGDLVVDQRDVTIMEGQWLEKEPWRSGS